MAKIGSLPVIEIFGPTIQGEGALAGLPTHFVRFGGCDYRCSWCDSMYAVDPAEVRAHAVRLTPEEIVERLVEFGQPEWITLSGGNPALFHLSRLVQLLHQAGYRVAVETQGSRWRPWLGEVDCLTVSPKPPSSGMVNPANDEETRQFMVAATGATQEVWALRNRDVRALKIVVFDRADLDWARAFIQEWHEWPAYLSVGTDQPQSSLAGLTIARTATITKITDRYAWLCTEVAADPALRNVRVLPQLHVLAWGHARAV